jgi:hypothetical protein
MSLPLGVEVSMGSRPERHTCGVEPVVGVHDDEQRPAESVELGDQHGRELARPGILQEPPTLWPLVQRYGAGDAVVFVHVRHLQLVKAAELLQELLL